MPETTWTSYDVEGYGRLVAAEKDLLPDSSSAFPFSRKEPMTDAQHVRNAIARFDQVEGVTATASMTKIPREVMSRVGLHYHSQRLHARLVWPFAALASSCSE